MRRGREKTMVKGNALLQCTVHSGGPVIPSNTSASEMD